MSHARKQIRDAVVTLVTGLSTTGSSVFSFREHAFAASDLPCLNVLDNPDGENAELVTMSSGTNMRTLMLRVEGRAKSSATLETVLDAIASEVEAVLDGAKPAGAKLCRIAGTSKDISVAGAVPHGLVNIDFEITYNTARGAPDTIV